MTGWRIGHGAGPSELIKPMTKLLSQSTSNPSSVAQAGALEGAFYVFPSCQGILGSTTKEGKRIETSDDFVLYLLDSVGLAVLQGTAYGVPPYFRISFATSMKNMEEGCKRLASACAALTR